MLNHLSLFSGIGGIDLAANWAGFETVAFCEQNKFCQKVLSKHWPEVPIFDDIFKLSAVVLEQRGIKPGSIKLISGGFPCQPYSHAGKRMGNEDDRALWPEMFRVIKEVRPDWVCGENVTGLISMALDSVLSDLESAGYTCQPIVLPACAVNAPHRRDRVFIIAHNDGSGGGASGQGKNAEKGATSPFERNSQIIAHPKYSGCQRGESERERASTTLPHGEKSKTNVVAYPQSFNDGHVHYGESEAIRNGTGENERLGPTFPGSSQWEFEPDVGRVAHGVPGRVDRLRALGNAVVPQQVYPILKAIADYEAGLS